jgi:hypothetical protein
VGKGKADSSLTTLGVQSKRKLDNQASIDQNGSMSETQQMISKAMSSNESEI